MKVEGIKIVNKKLKMKDKKSIRTKSGMSRNARYRFCIDMEPFDLRTKIISTVVYIKIVGNKISIRDV